MFGCRGRWPGQAAAALCTGGTMSSHYWLELIVCGNMQISQRTRSTSDVRLILILADSFVTPQADGEITSLVPQLHNTTIRFSSSHYAAIRSLHQYQYLYRRYILGWFVNPWENKATDAWLELQTKVREDFTTRLSLCPFVPLCWFPNFISSYCGLTPVQHSVFIVSYTECPKKNVV